MTRSTVGDSVLRVKKYAALRGYAPEHDMMHYTPDTHYVKGVSTRYNAEGQVAGQWVKTDVNKEDSIALMQAVIDGLVKDMPVYKPTNKIIHGSSDLMAVYPLGDPHIGMLALADEAGEDWDIAKAREVFIGIFTRLVLTAPPCKQSVIVNLGDYFHADNIAGTTTRSGHPLDTDKNFLTMADVGVEILLHMIMAALEHHETVRVINAIGNHDDTGSMFLQVTLKHMFKNEPRVIIDVTANPYNFVRFGKCFFGVHHGHTTKADKLPLVMATDKPQDWGETQFRYWYTGHIHHDTLKEYNGCTVESFRTLAAKDSYASWGGYRSGQDSKAIVLHKDFGEVERHTVNIAQLGSKL
nr:oxidoreductase [Glaciecola nitratireducens]